MHPKFLDLLCCPETREALTLDAQVTLQNGIVWAGTLRSPSRAATTRSSAACLGSSSAEQLRRQLRLGVGPLAARAVRVGERRPADGGAHHADVGAHHRRGDSKT